MKIVFVGAADLAVMTARLLIDHGHDVVIIERDKAVIDDLHEEMDCAFLHGDGTRPHILREAGPEQTDILFCLTNHSQENIIASLVGRSLGFRQVITSIGDPEFEPICEKLGLEHTIVPTRTISRYLVDIVRGVDVLELSTLLRGDARFFSFTARTQDATAPDSLELPARTKIVCLYRDGDFTLPEDVSKLHEGDLVVVITSSEHIPTLRERWQPKTAGDDGSVD